MSQHDDSVVTWLGAHGAHHDLIEWAKQHASSWSSFWLTCPRGDWLLGIAARAGVAQRDVMRAALACLPVLDPYLPHQEPSLSRALSWVQRVAQADTPIDPQEHAAIEADLERLLSRCSDPSLHAAVIAVQALVATCHDVATAASFVAATVQAAMMDAVDCGMLQAARFTEHECARLVRGAIELTTLQQALKRADSTH